MGTAHAITSPSAAHRWLICTPSARFEQQIPEEDTPYSREGTLAHNVAALILSSRAGIFKGSQKHFNRELAKLEDEVYDFYAQQDQPSQFYLMLDHAEDYADFVMSFMPVSIKKGDSTLLIEKRVYMHYWAALCDGTTDATLITPKVLYVNDYKYGAGKRVTAVKNEQGMLYALGALEEAWKLGYDPDLVVISIFQPRVSEDASTWQVSVDELLKWAEEVLRPRAILAAGGQGEFVAGSHCQFCKAKRSCLAWHKEFENLIDIKDKRIMTQADVAKVLEFGDGVASWVKGIKDDVRRDLQAGKKMSGFKLVAGRKTRAFKSEAVAIDELVSLGYQYDDMYRTQFRPMGEIEGLLGKDKFAQVMADNLITNEALPQIVPEDDDRQAVCATGFDEYAKYDEGRSKKRNRSARR